MAGAKVRRFLNWLFHLKLRTFSLLLGSVLLFYILLVTLQQVINSIIYADSMRLLEKRFTSKNMFVQVAEELTTEEIKVPVKWTGNFAGL